MKVIFPPSMMQKFTVFRKIVNHLGMRSGKYATEVRDELKRDELKRTAYK